MVRDLPASAEDTGSILGKGRCPGGGHGNPLQCSCLENPMDRGAWDHKGVHGVTKSRTQLTDYAQHIYYLWLPSWRYGKEPACQCRRHKRLGFNPWVRKTPWRRAWQSPPVFLPGNPHGQKSLEGYSLQGHKESDRT